MTLAPTAEAPTSTGSTGENLSIPTTGSPHERRIQELWRLTRSKEPQHLSEKGANFVKLGQVLFLDGYRDDAAVWAQTVVDQVEKYKYGRADQIKQARYTPALADAHALLGIIEASRILEDGQPYVPTDNVIIAIEDRFQRARALDPNQPTVQEFMDYPLAELWRRKWRIEQDRPRNIDEEVELKMLNTAMEYRKRKYTKEWCEYIEATPPTLTQDSPTLTRITASDGTPQYFTHEGAEYYNERYDHGLMGIFEHAVQENARDLDDGNVLIAVPLDGNIMYCYVMKKHEPDGLARKNGDPTMSFAFTLPENAADAFNQSIQANPNLIEHILQNTPSYQQGQKKLQQRAMVTKLHTLTLTTTPTPSMQDRITENLRNTLTRSIPYMFNPPVGEIPHEETENRANPSQNMIQFIESHYQRRSDLAMEQATNFLHQAVREAGMTRAHAEQLFIDMATWVAEDTARMVDNITISDLQEFTATHDENTYGITDRTIYSEIAFDAYNSILPLIDQPTGVVTSEQPTHVIEPLSVQISRDRTRSENSNDFPPNQLYVGLTYGKREGGRGERAAHVTIRGNILPDSDHLGQRRFLEIQADFRAEDAEDFLADLLEGGDRANTLLSQLAQRRGNQDEEQTTPEFTINPISNPEEHIHANGGIARRIMTDVLNAIAQRRQEQATADYAERIREASKRGGPFTGESIPSRGTIRHKKGWLFRRPNHRPYARHE